MSGRPTKFLRLAVASGVVALRGDKVKTRLILSRNDSRRQVEATP